MVDSKRFDPILQSYYFILLLFDPIKQFLCSLLMFLLGARDKPRETGGTDPVQSQHISEGRCFVQEQVRSKGHLRRQEGLSP